MKNILLILSLILLTADLRAQEGKYLQIYGGGQSTQLNNSQESYYGASAADYVTPVETDRAFFGANYIYNFHNYFGFQTGVSYSMQGQSYTGYIQHDPNPRFKGDTIGGDSNIYYKSHVYLNYIKVPILFRFNSGKAEDNNISFSVYGGIQIAYLLAVQDVSTTPPPPAWLTDQPIKYKQFFNSLDFEWCAGAEVNYFVSKSWGINLGMKYDRSLMDVESKNYTYDPSRTYPAEDYYPISVKKSVVPSQSDQYTRFSTKNNTLALYLGVFIILK